MEYLGATQITMLFKSNTDSLAVLIKYLQIKSIQLYVFPYFFSEDNYVCTYLDLRVYMPQQI